MSEYIDIRNSTELFRYTKYDFDCIVDVSRRHFGKSIDVNYLLLTMRSTGIIDEKQYDRHKRKFSDGTDLGKFLLHFLLFLSIEQLCFVFEEVGYKDISTDMRMKRFTLLYKNCPQKEIPHSKRTHDYYKTLKSCIDNDSFNLDRVLQLRKFIEGEDAKIAVTGDIAPHDRQFAMERKAVAIVLLLQQYTDNDARKHILNQAIATETNGADNSSLEIIYHSKMALTEAQAGNADIAEEHILKTRDLCRITGPCFAVTCAFHDIDYSYLCLYFKNSSEEMLEKVLCEGDIAIQSLKDEREDVQNLWKRIVLLFMVLSLLCITPNFVVKDLKKLKEAHKKRAEQILKEVVRCSDDIELRRQMIVYLCLAALNEDKDLSTAEEYAKLSLIFAEKGGCFRDIEKCNIKAYVKNVQNKILLSKLYKYMTVFILALCTYQLIGICINIDNMYTFPFKLVLTLFVLIFIWLYNRHYISE